MVPDRQPPPGHSGRSSTALDPDILKPGEVLNLDHHFFHSRIVSLALIKVLKKGRAQFLEGRNVLLLQADQPEVDHLNYGETL